MSSLNSLIRNHSRHFREMKYVYPVISRRSGGLSIGVNLSPTARCNFACVYCQVLGDPEDRLQSPLGTDKEKKRNTPPGSPLVDIPLLDTELRDLVRMACDGTLFDDPRFSGVPPEKRALRDIAFSGDGEPTLSRQFPEIVRRVVLVRKELCPESTKIVLITNGTTLDVPAVREALRVLSDNKGEIWAKLDAGTPEHYRTVSRSSVPFEKILGNLASAAREFPLVIQSCFLTLHGKGPSPAEIKAYVDRLRSITGQGGRIDRVQLYTVARNTPEPWAGPLENEQLDAITETVRRETGLSVESFYSA